LGAQVAQGDILFFMDADVAVPPNTMEQIASTFRQNPGLTALFGSYDDETEANNFLSQYKNLSHHYIHQRGRDEASTFWGACGAIRREVFMGMGGFDERYRRPSIEDIEFGYRLNHAGYRIKLCKVLQVKHLKRWGVVSLLKSDFLHRALPWTELILRDHHFINDLNLRFSSRTSVILVYALLAAFIGTWWWRGCFLIGSVICLSLLVINAPLYRFLVHKGGLWFTMRAIVWHWFYYFYSGLAFAIGLSRFLSSSMKSSGLSFFPFKKGQSNRRDPRSNIHEP
jgi:GT2 family glycosyltransferase